MIDNNRVSDDETDTPGAAAEATAVMVGRREGRAGPWRTRPFDSEAEARRARPHEHLGTDVVDLGPVLPVENGVPAGWAAAGYTTPDSVAEWTSIGIDSPVVAGEWIEAGFTPEQAGMWVSCGDMNPSQALAAVNAGVAPVDIARVQRADPGWDQAVEPEIAAPDMGPWL